MPAARTAPTEAFRYSLSVSTSEVECDAALEKRRPLRWRNMGHMGWWWARDVRRADLSRIKIRETVGAVSSRAGRWRRRERCRLAWPPSYPYAVAAVAMVFSLSTDSLFVGLRAMQALPNGLGGSACFFCEIRTLLLTASR